MKYDHMVKVNGQYYPAGTEIPEPDTAEVPEEQQTEEVAEENIPDPEPPKRGRKSSTSK